MCIFNTCKIVDQFFQVLPVLKSRIPGDIVDYTSLLKSRSRQLQQPRLGQIYPSYPCQAIHKLDPRSSFPPYSLNFPHKANTLQLLFPHQVVEEHQLSVSVNITSLVQDTIHDPRMILSAFFGRITFPEPQSTFSLPC